MKRSCTTDLKQLSLGLCGHASRSLRPTLIQFPFQVPQEISFHGVGIREVISALIPVTTQETKLVTFKSFLHLLIPFLSP
ncbi:unnamed protein product [Schistosoma mattheei]|uniref:Uncharacterized protein n=1 Tax=Schistosoma mattheei TaxID=31246 RepID=A0A183PYJ9_9TREM|nr:unnamed protein product [Schistosoma mattheei]